MPYSSNFSKLASAFIKIPTKIGIEPKEINSKKKVKKFKNKINFNFKKSLAFKIWDIFDIIFYKKTKLRTL